MIVNTGSSATLVSKTVTKNGVYDPASDNADGYSGVTVNVGSGPINFYAWKSVGTSNGNAVWGDKSVTLTATGSDCYTNYMNADFPASAKILVRKNQTVTLEWTATGDASVVNGARVMLFQAGYVSNMIEGRASVGSLSLTVNTDNTFVTFRVGVQAAGQTITYSNIRYTITDPT